MSCCCCLIIVDLVPAHYLLTLVYDTDIIRTYVPGSKRYKMSPYLVLLRAAPVLYLSRVLMVLLLIAVQHWLCWMSTGRKNGFNVKNTHTCFKLSDCLSINNSGSPKRLSCASDLARLLTVHSYQPYQKQRGKRRTLVLLYTWYIVPGMLHVFYRT